MLYIVAIYFLDNMITITVEIILKNGHRNIQTHTDFKKLPWSDHQTDLMVEFTSKN